MDLDQQVKVLTDMALRTNSLDVVDQMVVKYGNMYSDIAQEAGRIRNLMATGVVNPYAFPPNTIVDIRGLLQLEDEEFVENAYIKILGRAADAAGLEAQLKALREGAAGKEAILHSMGESEEAKQNNTLLTGFSVLDVSEFLQYREKEFVDMAFVKILGRHADPTGVEHFLMPLLTGERSGEEILYMILHSPEGEARNLTINGLEALYQKRCKKKRILQIPVLGKGVKFVWNLRNLNRRLSALVVREYCAEQELERLKAQDSASLEKVKGRVSALEEGLNHVGGHLNAVGQLLNGVAWKLEKHIGDTERSGQEMQEQIQSALGQIEEIRKQTAAMQEEISFHGAELGRLLDGNKGVYSSVDYFDFENRFRGSREHVKNVQTMYLPYYEGKKNVLDLGCGRGEFTEMLAERNVGVIGVDQYGPYVEYVKSLGLPAVQDDALHYLSEQEKVDGIFLGQVVEHITVGQIMDICKLAYDKLEEGCYLIMETPNPTSLAIFTTSFYVDPSHQKPIHPLTLKYLVEKAGFSSVEILYTQPSRMPFHIPRIKESDPEMKEFNDAMTRVSETLYGSRDYAIVARK